MSKFNEIGIKLKELQKFHFQYVYFNLLLRMTVRHTF